MEIDLKYKVLNSFYGYLKDHKKGVSNYIIDSQSADGNNIKEA